MVKAILLEIYLNGASIIGPSHVRDGTSNFELGLDNWILTKGRINWGVQNTFLRNGLPKGWIVRAASLRIRYFACLTKCSIHSHSKRVFIFYCSICYLFYIISNALRELVPSKPELYALTSLRLPQGGALWGEGLAFADGACGILNIILFNFNIFMERRGVHITTLISKRVRTVFTGGVSVSTPPKGYLSRSNLLIVGSSSILTNCHITSYNTMGNLLSGGIYGVIPKQGRAYYSSLKEPKNTEKLSLLVKDWSEVKVAVHYDNVELVKSEIISENKGKAGVYCFTNKINGKFYVGSSVNLSIRFKNYMRPSYLNRHSSMAIYRALLKYGYSNFQLDILEFTSREKALEREQHYLDILNELGSPCYNLLKIAGSLLGYKVKEETKARLRVANLGAKNPNFGKSHSQEILKKISESTSGENHYTASKGLPGNSAFKGKTHSGDTKYKMSIAKLGANNPNFGKTMTEEAKLNLSYIRGSAVEVCDMETGEKSYYPSINKAASALSCGKSTIYKYLDSKELYKGKYKVTKIPKNNGEDDSEGPGPRGNKSSPQTPNKPGESPVLLEEGVSVILFYLQELSSVVVKYLCGGWNNIKANFETYLYCGSTLLRKLGVNWTYYGGLLLDNLGRQPSKGRHNSPNQGINYPYKIRKELAIYTDRQLRNYGIAYCPQGLRQRRDHSTTGVLTINFLNISRGNLSGLFFFHENSRWLIDNSKWWRLEGRVPGKFMSTCVTKVADNVSVKYKLDSPSKLDKLNMYVNKRQISLINSNQMINIPLYNLLYDINIYLLAYTQLNSKFNESALVLTERDIELFTSRSYRPKRGGQISTAVPRRRINSLNILASLFQYKFIDDVSSLFKNDQSTMYNLIVSTISLITAGNYNFTKISPFLLNSVGRCRVNYIASHERENLTKDLLVVKVIVMILETLNKPVITSSLTPGSVRFVEGGPVKSAQAALKEVKLKFSNYPGGTRVKWFIKGDLSNCLDLLGYNVLMPSIEMRLKDKRFTDLVWKSLKAGYFNHLGYKNNQSGFDNDLRSLLYPMLVDIYLGGLDSFILYELEKLFHQKHHSLYSGKLIKLSYVRYLDQWVIGISGGSHSDCIIISNMIRDYLKEVLNLDMLNTDLEIVNSCDSLIFLGVSITFVSKKDSKNTISKVGKVEGQYLKLIAPIRQIENLLTRAGFLKNRKSVPRLVWTGYDKMVIRYLYHSWYNSFINYYELTDNNPKLASYMFKVLNSSCAKLLASKFSLSSQKKVYMKFGSDLIGRRPLTSTQYHKYNGRLSFFPIVINRFSSSAANIASFNIKSYISGFIDGEGTFYIKIAKSSTIKTGYSVQLSFGLTLHSRELALLKLIQGEFSGIGFIWDGSGQIQYQISNIKQLGVLIAHLDKYPLLTRKSSDFLLFKQAWEMIVKKEHLTEEGLIKIISIKAKMNGNGLSPKLKAAYPKLIPIVRPLGEKFEEGLIEWDKFNISWLSGFIDAEGCFFVHLKKSSKYKAGYQVSLKFQITQDTADANLLQNIVNYFGCGYYRAVAKNCDGRFEVEKFQDILDKVIPFLDKHPLLGSKANDLADFKKVALLIKDKEHLTDSGVEIIKQIKSGMNRARGDAAS